MLKGLGRRRETKKQKSKQLWGRDFNVVKEGLDEEQVVSFVDELLEQRGESSPASVSSVIKAAVSEAEQIVASIKTRALTEAEEEAARIIIQANQEAEVIKERTGTVAEREVADIQAVPSREAEIVEAEISEQSMVERVEEPARIEQEAAVSKAVEAIGEELVEQGLPEERSGSEASEPVVSKKDSRTLIVGEVDLTIKKPVDPKMVSKLYHFLQTTPEIKFVRTSGSWDRGTTVTIVLDKPTALVSVLSSRLPEAEIDMELPEKNDLVAGRKGVRRILIALKEG